MGKPFHPIRHSDRLDHTKAQQTVDVSARPQALLDITGQPRPAHVSGSLTMWLFR